MRLIRVRVGRLRTLLEVQMAQPSLYGGQAVIEGVLIRGQRHAVVACRRKDGSVVTRTEQLAGMMAGQPATVPLVRGILLLGETMQLGVRSLFFSSRVADGHDPETPMDTRSIVTAISISLAAAALIFFALPLAMTDWLEPRLGHTSAVLMEGAVRLIILLAYVRGIAFVPGVRRLFEHHGAEHMTVNAYEAGVPLTVEDVRRFSVVHKRCGTAFFFTVMIVSLFAFGALGPQPFVESIISRIVLIPAIAAVAYEVLRLGAQHGDHPLVRLLARPSLALQALTTRGPDDEQIALAIIAMRSVLALDGVLADDGHEALVTVAVD